MYDYILHCLKSTYKYFALPLSANAANHKREAKQGYDQGDSTKDVTCLSDLSRLSLQSQQTSPGHTADNGPEDSDCIIEEEEEVEGCSDSDEDKEKEKVDPGKGSLSEDEDEEEQDEDVDTDNNARDRQHLDSFTTEEEEIFPVDEISGEDLLSDEEAPDLDTPGSLDEDEEEEEVDLAPDRLSPRPGEDRTEGESVAKKTPNQTKQSYEFTRQAFTRGKVGLILCFSACNKRRGNYFGLKMNSGPCVFFILVTHGRVQFMQAWRTSEERLSRRF